MRKDEKTKMRDFWSVHRGVEGEETISTPRRWRRRSTLDRDKAQAHVQMFPMLPPPAEEDPFLK